MSFCKEVKNELIGLRTGWCCKPAMVYGLMLFGRAFSIKKISIQTNNENVAKAYCNLIKEVYKIEPSLSVGGTARPTYKAEVSSESERLKILASIDFGIEEEVIDRTLFLRDCCINSFIRGVFLACGNINDPEKEYRAEFNVKTEKLADELLNLLLESGIVMRKVAAKNGFKLYTKESAVIEDLLTLIGAGKQTLNLIDTKIMKSVKNNINRARNCDSANISKTVEASIRQRTAIEFLEKKGMLYSLPEELKSVALLRKENESASLKELCRLSNEPISVSGLNHRFEKIIKIYEELK
ncbi:MAG: DNA-binding protein WhiA [Clostridia bacterium]|nr:DNA-binding protein WhiA [Clostridia bacterium]